MKIALVASFFLLGRLGELSAWILVEDKSMFYFHFELTVVVFLQINFFQWFICTRSPGIC